MQYAEFDLFRDADALTEWLAAAGFVPYVDFEILTVTLSDGAVEVDPKGRPDRLFPALRQFGQSSDFTLLPYDESTGNFQLAKIPAFA